MRMKTINQAYFNLLGDIFNENEVIPTKGDTQNDLNPGNDIAYITASKKNNGFGYFIDNDSNKEYISKGNCILLIQIGEGGAGYATYQEKDFIGMKGKTICCYSKYLNKYNGIYLATVLCKERFRYSFGRSWTGVRLKNTKIKLPCIYANNKPIPDWQYMENYIKSLKITLPITNNSILSDKYKIDIDKWKYFELGYLFNIETGTDLIYQEQEVGKYPVVGHNETNNGITCYIKKLPHRKLYNHNKTISLGDRGCFIAYVQPHDFYIGTRVKALISKSPLANIWNLQFISTIINQEKFKYNYGRNATDKIPRIKIKLPITSDGDLDWQFMEDYIKSLPYGDCL